MYWLSKQWARMQTVVDSPGVACKEQSCCKHPRCALLHRLRDEHSILCYLTMRTALHPDPQVPIFGLEYVSVFLRVLREYHSRVITCTAVSVALGLDGWPGVCVCVCVWLRARARSLARLCQLLPRGISGLLMSHSDAKCFTLEHHGISLCKYCHNMTERKTRLFPSQYRVRTVAFPILYISLFFFFFSFFKQCLNIVVEDLEAQLILPPI